MPELPTGTVTFLFTDIEGNTVLGEQLPAAMRQALVRHDTPVEQFVGEHEWQVVRPHGEGRPGGHTLRSLLPQRKSASLHGERLAIGSVSAITNVDTTPERKTGL